MTNLDKVLKRDITLLTKVHMFKAIFFLVVISGHESGVIEEAKKSWFFWIVVLGCHSCIESPLGSKEIKPINPKGNQPWIFISRTDAERLISRSLAGCSPWGCKESDTTEWLTLSFFNLQIVSILPLPFRFGYLDFLFTAWWIWIGLPKLSWIIVVRVDVFCVCLISEDKLLVSYSQVWC